MAFGLLDGSIYLIRGKNLLNSDFKDQIINLEKNAIINMFFSKEENFIHLFYSTKSSLYCFQNLTAKKLLHQPGSSVAALNSLGMLYFANPENQNIIEFSNLQQLRMWNWEGEKVDIKSFGQNYLLVASLIRSENIITSFTIYDISNNYIAFSAQFSSIQLIINAHNQIYIISLSQKGEKQLIKLTEKDNNFKFETFFKRSFFDVALKFAEFQKVEPMLLAEISKLHGDHLYTKGFI